jgi:Zn2+/Cd2+-exporting ATPase
MKQLTARTQEAFPADRPFATANPGGDVSFASMAVRWLFSPRGEVSTAAVAGVLLLAGWLCSALGLSAAAPALWLIALGLGLIHGCKAAWEALAARTFDIDVLMAVAAILSAALGAIWEGALLLFLFVLAGGLEGLAMQRTTRAVEALHRLMPTKALRQTPAGTFEEVAPELLAAGDIVKILPGESIPADCEVREGATSVDQANLTGESMPRSVAVSDEVFAGTINVGNPVLARVKRVASESSLQRVLRLVTEAQQRREPAQRLIDRINEPYAIGVMCVSIAVLLIWWLVLGDSLGKSSYTAITLLIVMSPCAVIIATPTATLAGIARGARGGVLFKGGQAIERLSRLRAVAFDKTGTLTVGKMRVLEVHPVGWSDADKLLGVAAGLEVNSTHPIARAILSHADAQGVAPTPGEHPGFVAGRGVHAMFAGEEARLGTMVFVEPLVPECLKARIREVLASVQSRGKIGTVVAWNQQAGVIKLADTVRPGAEQLVQDLHGLGIKPVVMLTGDNRSTAFAVANQLGLDRFEAELLPEDKVRLIHEIKATARASGGARAGAGVIGDGVNDAPALAAADVSMAIGSIGSDAALESADIVLLSDDLRSVPWAVGLARRTTRTIAINLLLALGAIVVMAIITLVGSRTGHQVPLWMGVLTHEGGTILVVAHSLLLLGYPGLTLVQPLGHSASGEADP